MDQLDEKLITLLRHNGRRSISDLAIETGASRATIRARMEKLEQTGTIIGYTVILRADAAEDGTVSADDLRNHVANEIGAIARPKAIFITPDLPKTRSGKIMRRLLRDVAEGRNLGDTTPLADASVVDELQARAASATPED